MLQAHTDTFVQLSVMAAALMSDEEPSLTRTLSPLLHYRLAAEYVSSVCGFLEVATYSQGFSLLGGVKVVLLSPLLSLPFILMLLRPIKVLCDSR